VNNVYLATHDILQFNVKDGRQLTV